MSAAGRDYSTYHLFCGLLFLCFACFVFCCFLCFAFFGRDSVPTYHLAALGAARVALVSLHPVSSLILIDPDTRKDKEDEPRLHYYKIKILQVRIEKGIGCVLKLSIKRIN